MKTAICYFSGTGNSLFVAERLAEHIPDSKIFNIAQLVRDNSPLNEYEKIGIVFPVYFYGLPNIIKRFVSAFSFEGIKYIFAVATYSGVSGDAINSLKNEVAKTGQLLSYASKITMPDSYTITFSVQSEQMIELKNRSARIKCEKIAKDVKESKRKIPAFSPLAVTKHFSGTDKEKDRKFILTAACNGCGKCARLCPVGNISMKNERPQFHHNCEFCLACFHRCPKKAINYGAKTIRKERYVNPEVQFPSEEIEL
ncbi:MAG: EFR1 family ferrodoxin [Clostridiales bacterium]|nr:EFR1 family ferrodoxin [Clostridiales bacterium]